MAAKNLKNAKFQLIKEGHQDGFRIAVCFGVPQMKTLDGSQQEKQPCNIFHHYSCQYQQKTPKPLQ